MGYVIWVYCYGCEKVRYRGWVVTYVAIYRYITRKNVCWSVESYIAHLWRVTVVLHVRYVNNVWGVYRCGRRTINTAIVGVVCATSVLFCKWSWGSCVTFPNINRAIWLVFYNYIRNTSWSSYNDSTAISYKVIISITGGDNYSHYLTT